MQTVMTGFVFIGAVVNIALCVGDIDQKRIIMGQLVNQLIDIRLIAVFHNLLSGGFGIMNKHRIIESLQKDRLQKP